MGQPTPAAVALKMCLVESTDGSEIAAVLLPPPMLRFYVIFRPWFLITAIKSVIFICHKELLYYYNC